MVRWLLCLLITGIIFSQDDGLPPNFVYLEPIENFFSREPISLQIIVTDRNELDMVALFYRFNDENTFSKRNMNVSNQPVIYDVEIPLDEVVPGFIQYYFWARDAYGNESTWPSGGEDLPIVLPIYPTKKEEIIVSKEIPKLVEGFQPPEELADNVPYYLEIGMLAPPYEVTYEAGVPIIVISVYDAEKIVNLESVQLLIDGQTVKSYNSSDMITYIPPSPFEAGYHIIRYEAKNVSGDILVKEFSFFMNKKIIDESEIEKITWKETINFKGDFGWNTDYDPSGNTIDIHKINSAIKFQLGDYKFNASGLMSTHIYDRDAREEAKHRQPSSRLKFKMKSPYLEYNYGDNSPEFSEFSLKGTRVRGNHVKIKWGSWETSFVSGETKHWVDDEYYVNVVNIWDSGTNYKIGDQVYDNSIAWIAVTENTQSEPCVFVADTCADNFDWMELNESEYTEISNDVCTAVEPAMYGLNPDTLSLIANGTSIADVDTYWIWNGISCEEVFVYSSINMITGENGINTGELYTTYDECRTNCLIPVNFQKGSPFRQLQGFRTSKDFYEHAKFGISAIRSWDVRDENLIPYLTLDEYIYEGNIAVASDFMFHFNHDKTVLSGEYGLSMTINQTYSDTVLLKNIHNIDQNLYSYTDWSGVDYCLQDPCVDINGDSLFTTPESQFIEGVSDSLISEINTSRKELGKIEKILGFKINDDINGYAEGRGLSGLTGPEVGQLINGGLDSIHLLFKKPAFKVIFKTPIPLSFTELNFQTEFNQAPLNYLSHGSSSIQTDVRNWKNKLGFKVLKNQLNFSFGYDNQIKSPWDPESEADGEIKRSITDTKSGSIGLSFSNYPGLNYSIRLQDREDMIVSAINGTLSDSTTGLKEMSTHTIAPTYKISFGKTNINLNGNITLVNDLDLLTDVSGCYEVLNNTASSDWGGILDTAICGIDSNYFYFEKGNNPLRDSGNLTSTYTGAISFSFPSPLSLNLGWGMSINSPNDLRQSETVITVLSAKWGYKFFENNLNVTLGANYVMGFKGGNGFWDSGETFTIDGGTPDQFDPNDEFIDNIELDNNKLALKVGLQYKMPVQKITIGLNLDYSQATDNLTTSQEDPVFKAKIAIKYGF